MARIYKVAENNYKMVAWVVHDRILSSFQLYYMNFNKEIIDLCKKSKKDFHNSDENAICKNL